MHWPITNKISFKFGYPLYGSKIISVQRGKKLWIFSTKQKQREVSKWKPSLFYQKYLTSMLNHNTVSQNISVDTHFYTYQVPCREFSIVHIKQSTHCHPLDSHDLTKCKEAWVSVFPFQILSKYEIMENLFLHWNSFVYSKLDKKGSSHQCLVLLIFGCLVIKKCRINIRMQHCSITSYLRFLFEC